MMGVLEQREHTEAKPGLQLIHTSLSIALPSTHSQVIPRRAWKMRPGSFILCESILIFNLCCSGEMNCVVDQRRVGRAAFGAARHIAALFAGRLSSTAQDYSL